MKLVTTIEYHEYNTIMAFSGVLLKVSC